MEILVCIKQVPATTDVLMDEKKGVLKREGMQTKINPYDLFALEYACLLKEKTGGRITVLSMGPVQAKDAVKEAYMMGADQGYLLCDPHFAGADTLATAYTLYQGIRVIGRFDLVLCGKQTTDGDTGQTGPALSEFLRIPCETCVTNIEVNKDKTVTTVCQRGDCVETVQLKTPCLLCVEKEAVVPRLPSFKRKLETIHTPVKMVALHDLIETSACEYGLDGSPTHVERIFPPSHNKQHVKYDDAPERLARRWYETLCSLKFIDEPS